MPVGLATALTFLTRWPFVHDVGGAAQVGRASGWFPLVGALLGGLQWACWIVLLWSASLFGWTFDARIVAVLLVLVHLWATGALHEDGLADTFDGFGGGHDKTRVLEIMRDPTIGAFGAIALTMSLMARVILLERILVRPEGHAILIVAPALARCCAVWLGGLLPYARNGSGLGRTLTDHVRWPQCAWASASALAVGMLVGPERLLWLVLAAVLVTWWVGRMFMRRVGGITGDGLGACIVASELACLLVAVVMPP